jgi:SLOG-like protein/TIR domain-containing protein
MTPRPLQIFVLWHPKFTRGQELAETLYGHFCSDPAQPASRALRIPVRFRSLTAEEATSPPEVKLDAERTAIIVLVDDEMVDDSIWGEYVAAIHGECEKAATDAEGYPQHRVFPVSLSQHAFKLHPTIAEINYMRLHDVPKAQQTQTLLNGFTHELARLLLDRPQVGDEDRMRKAGPAPIRVFLSHAKSGGLDLAQDVRQHIAQQTQLDTFFDAHDIPPGSQWRDVLLEEAGSGINALLVLQTDAYSTREWCRIEALQAKLGWVPTVVVQAVEQVEVRSFPYLGNVPTIRWPIADAAAPWGDVLGKLLYEVLRAAYFPKWVEYVAALYGVKQPLKPLPYPPELLTLLSMTRHEQEHPGTAFVYPDPPLGTEELEILHEASPNLRMMTPICLPMLAQQDSPPTPDPDRCRYPLAGLTVGVSVSDVPKAELAARGLGTMHLEHAFWELTRHLLSLGANVAYGGDHRVGGYTQRLFDLVRTYTPREFDPSKRVSNHLAWPIHRTMTAADRNQVKDAAELVPCPLPDDLEADPIVEALQPDESLAWKPAVNRRVWARCLTAMRKQMNDAIDARVLLGGRYGGFVDGKLDAYRGKYAGLVEEAHFAITTGKPTFLLGGFGGCTAVIIDALRGNAPAPLTVGFHTAADPAYKDLVENHPLEPDTPIDYGQVRSDLNAAQVGGLNNSLSNEANQQLFLHDEVEEVVAIVVSGLCTFNSKREGED